LLPFGLWFAGGVQRRRRWALDHRNRKVGDTRGLDRARVSCRVTGLLGYFHPRFSIGGGYM
jgi:hypothetical protein